MAIKIAGTTVIDDSRNIVAGIGTAGAPSLTFTGDPDTGIYSPGADQVAVATNGVGRLFVDASGNVAIAQTPSNAASFTRSFNISALDASIALRGNSGGTYTDQGIFFAVDGVNYSQIYNDGIGQLIFRTGSGLSERLRIDSSGRLLVGTSSARETSSGNDPFVQFERSSGSALVLSATKNGADAFGPYFALIKSRGTSAGANNLVSSGDEIGSIFFYGTDGTNPETGAAIQAYVDGTPGANDMPGRLVFSTTADGASSPTERMRITQSGSAAICVDNIASIAALWVASKGTSNTTQYLFYGTHSATGVQTGTGSFLVFNNGNVQNTNNSYAGISDIKLKENIVDAASQWNDIKALRPVNYNLKPETGHSTHTQIGLVAQEVELVSPGLVSESPDRDEDGNDLGTVTKSVSYSVLYMKAVKALQEAMERIESLEQRLNDAGIN